METFIALLRGINVSGKNMIKMDALKKLFEAFNFQHVTTYVQSGNIIFTALEKDAKKIEQLIHTQINQTLNLSVPVIVLTYKTLRQIIDNNPFVNGKEKEFLHVTFLASMISGHNPEIFENKKSQNEEISVAENAVYLYCPNGYGRTKLNNTYLESKLKVVATTRNWKTTLEILKLADHISPHN